MDKNKSNLPAKVAPADVELMPATKAETGRQLVMDSDILQICQKALPPNVDPVRWWRSFMTFMGKTKGLIDSDPGSLYNSLLEIAQTGLWVGGALGEVYLVPFKDNTSRPPCLLATVIYGYKGLITLVEREVDVIIHAKEVYEADLFEYEEGTAGFIRHKPSLQPNKGAVIASYALAKYHNGLIDFEVMDREQLDKVQLMAKGKDRAGSAYQTWPEMMDRKAPIRRLTNRMPKAVQARQAISREDARLEAFGFFDRAGGRSPIMMPQPLQQERLPEKPAPAIEEQPAASAPPPEPGEDFPRHVVLAKFHSSGQYRAENRKGQKWSKWEISFNDGVTCYTYSSTQFAKAERAVKENLVVGYETKHRAGTLELVDLILVEPVTDEPENHDEPITEEPEAP